jgi:hypothetical protein
MLQRIDLENAKSSGIPERYRQMEDMSRVGGDIMVKRLYFRELQDKVRECYWQNGVNHIEACEHLTREYMSLITPQDGKAAPFHEALK